MDTFEGKEVIVNAPSDRLFSSFSDLNNFKERIPAEYADKVTITPDTVEGEIGGMHMGLKVAERVPNSKIVFRPTGGFPLDFSLIFNMQDANISQTSLKISVETQMNFLTKAMFGKKIQEFVDKISETIGSYAQ